MRLLHRHAAIERVRIGALGDHPFRVGIDAGLVQQGRQRHAGPLGVGHEAVQRLRGRLHRLVGEHRRAVAAAFHERHARHHRIARQRSSVNTSGCFTMPWITSLCCAGIDIRHAGVDDGEVQAVGRDRAVEQMMRRARVRIAEFVVRIAQRAHHVLLEPRRRLAAPASARPSPGSTDRSSAARRRRRSAKRLRRSRAGQRDAASEQGAAIEQAVAGDVVRSADVCACCRCCGVAQCS